MWLDAECDHIPWRKFGLNFQVYWCGMMAGLEPETPNPLKDLFLEEKVFIYFFWVFFYCEKIFSNVIFLGCCRAYFV